ncbi:MAG TPA: pitrilysin family protein [Labilithrix sp.]|nr:pitrilysin family protein [Labilithrix sp.]
MRTVGSQHGIVWWLSMILALAPSVGCAGSVSSYAPAMLTDRAPAVPVVAPAAATDQDNDGPPPLTRAPRNDAPPSELHLSNGVRVLFVERHGLPLVSVGFLLRFDPSEAVNPVPDLYARAMKSSAQRSPRTPYSFLAAAGVTTYASCNTDVLVFGATMLAPHATEVIDHLSSALAAPAFGSRDLDLGERDLLAHRAWLRKNPSAHAAVQRMLLGDPHPARVRVFDVESIRAPSLDDLARFGRAYLSAENLTVAIVGDFRRAAVVSVLEARLGSLRRASPPRASRTKLPPWSEPAPPAIARVAIVPWRGATQSKISVAFAGPSPRSDDRAALLLVRELLSAFSGRLMRKIREEQGASYGVGAVIEWWRTGGAFEIGTSVEAGHTVATVDAIVREVARLGVDPIPDDELARAKGRVTARTTSSGGSPYDKDLYVLETVASQDLPLDAFVRLGRQLDALTAEDVRAAAARYLRTDRMQIAVAADPAAVEAPLRALGIGDVSIAPPP